MTTATPPGTSDGQLTAARLHSPDATWPARRGVDPFAGLVAALILGLSLVVTLDIASAATALVLELLFLPWVGASGRAWLRCTFLLAAACLAALTTALYGEVAGHIYVRWGILTVSSGSLTLAAAIALRVLAVGVPAVVLLARVDVTRLADALAQIVHLPARFVLGALAGMRLAALFVDDWRRLSLTRRARGLGGGGPVRRVRRAAWQVFALLVAAIRRGTVLAVAMEARGFGRAAGRTWARPARLTARDVTVITLAAAIAAAAIVVSLVTGSWNFVLA
ncbi:MAG TPA: energy-coupling factor transporter transmembrane component T [Microbacteriaceae bacterium]|nr:energy-coupling factor transporter transmembrane component T [Microbacteriaceae bacterium]